MIDKVRELALKVLYKIDKEEAYSNIALNEVLNANREKLKPQDVGLISEITYGVTTWKLTLDVIIEKHSKIKMKKISPWVKNILRMGIYQILFLDKIPQSAAVNESVNLAKRYGHKTSANFVNAILRKVSMVDYAELFKIKDPIEKISKTTSITCSLLAGSTFSSHSLIVLSTNSLPFVTSSKVTNPLPITSQLYKSCCIIQIGRAHV